MKKFRSKRVSDRKRKRNALIMGLTLVGLMIFSIIGFAIQGGVPGQSSFEYNGFEFNVQRTQQNILYFTEVDGLEIGFYNDPFYIDSLRFNETLKQDIQQAQRITFTSPPPSSPQSEGVDLRLVNLLVRDARTFTGIQVDRGYTSSDPFDPAPVVSCSQASQDNIVFVLNYEFQDELDMIVLADDYCYDVFATSFDLVVVRDYIIYSARSII